MPKATFIFQDSTTSCASQRRRKRRFGTEPRLNMRESLLEEWAVSNLKGKAKYPPRDRLGARQPGGVQGIRGVLVGEGAKKFFPAVGKAKISMRLPADLKSKE